MNRFLFLLPLSCALLIGCGREAASRSTTAEEDQPRDEQVAEDPQPAATDRPNQKSQEPIKQPADPAKSNEPSGPTADSLPWPPPGVEIPNNVPTNDTVVSPVGASILPADAGNRTLSTTLIRDLPQHEKGIVSVAFSPDGKLVATAGYDYKIKLANAQTRKLLYDLTFPEPDLDSFRHIASIDFSPDGTLLAASSDSRLVLFDFKAAETRELKIDGESTGRSCVRFTPTGDRLVGLNSRDIGVWSIPSGMLKREFKIEGHLTDDFALTPDGKFLAYDGPDNSVDLWNLATGELEHRFSGDHGGTVTCVAINPAGTLMASAALDDGVVVYDLQNRKTLIADSRHPNASALAFSSDDVLAIGFYDVDLFAVTQQGLKEIARCEDRGVVAASEVRFSPDGSQLLISDSTVRRGDLVSLQWSPEHKSLANDEKRIDAIATSPDGNWFAWSDRQSVTLYSAKEEKIVATTAIKTQPASNRSLAFSRDSQSVAYNTSRMGHGAGKMVCFSVPDLQQRFNLEGTYSSTLFPPDGRSALLWGYLGGPTVDLDTGEVSANEWSFSGKHGQFTSGDDPLLISADGEELFVYEWPSGQQLRHWFTGIEYTKIAISPARPWVATFGHSDRLVYVWDYTTGELVQEIKADSEGVFAAAFSADGRHLLASGHDERLKLWSCDDWTLRGNVFVAPGDTKAISVVPASRDVLTLSLRKYGKGAVVKHWDMKTLEGHLAVPSLAVESNVQQVSGAARYEINAVFGAMSFLDKNRKLFYLDVEDDQGQAILTDLESDEVQWKIAIGEPNFVDLSDDGRYVAASYGEDIAALNNDNANPALVKIWDTGNQQLVRTIKMETAVGKQIDFSPDGTQIAIASFNVGFDEIGEVGIWDIATGKLVQKVPTGDERFSFLRYSPDGTLLACGGIIRGFMVWDIQAGKKRFSMKLSDSLTGLTFSPDSRFVAVCGGEYEYGTIAVIDTTTGKQISLLSDFTEEANSVAFSPRGDLLAATFRNDQDRSGYRFYRLPEGKPIAELIVAETSGFDRLLKFSPDASLLAAQGYAAGMTIWEVDDLFDAELQQQIARLQDCDAHVTDTGHGLHIDLKYASINKATLKKFPLIKQPFTLNLQSVDGLTDDGIEPLIRQRNLVGLDISQTNVTDAAIEQLAKLTSLKSLNLTSTEVSEQGLQRLRTALPECEIIQE